MACVYIIKNAEGVETTFDDKAKMLEFVRKNNLLQGTGKKGKPEYTTDSLINVVKQDKAGEHNYDPADLREFQASLLEDFARLETEATKFFEVGGILALVKGAGKDFANIDKVKKSLKELGIEADINDDMPIDVRYLLTGDAKYLPEGVEDFYYHKISATNIKILNEINALSRTMIMERTPSFLYVADKTIANLDTVTMQYGDKAQQLKDELTAFAQIAAYKQLLRAKKDFTSTLRNSLIYDTEDVTQNIIDLVKEAIEKAPNNTFLKFILPMPTVVKMGRASKRKNPRNRDLVNTLEGRTRGKIEPDKIAGLMDSFSELYNSPNTKKYAKALFDYLIVKDGLMFKNRSFIKMIPPVMFTDVSVGTDFATKLLAANTIEELKRLANELMKFKITLADTNKSISYFPAEEREKSQLRSHFESGDVKKAKDALFMKLFGYDVNQFYNKYEYIYATDSRFQRNLSRINPNVFIKGVKQRAPGIVFKKDAKIPNKLYMYVDIFTEAHNKVNKFAEGGKAERKKIREATMAALQAAKFEVISEGTEGTRRHMFYAKKFIRVQNAPNTKGDILMRLVSINRHGKSILAITEGAVEDGQLVPRGAAAIYESIDEVGAANTTGVADLGERPTKAELIAFLNKKAPVQTQKVAIPATPTPEQGKLFNESSKVIKDHAMSYKMPAAENIWGRDTTTLIEAEAGTRTATTRSFALGVVGDVITFEKRPQKYKITAIEQLTEAKTKSREWVENWSKKEGWTVEHFHKVLGGSTVHIGSWQTTFQKVDEAGTPVRTTPTPAPTPPKPAAPAQAPAKGKPGGSLGDIMLPGFAVDEDFMDIEDINDEQVSNLTKNCK